MCACVFTSVSIYFPLSVSRIWHETLFKRNVTGLFSVFSFSLARCLTNGKEQCMLHNLIIAVSRIIGFIAAQRNLYSTKCNQTRSLFELGSLCLFTMTISITSIAPYVRIYVCICLYVYVCMFV